MPMTSCIAAFDQATSWIAALHKNRGAPRSAHHDWTGIKGAVLDFRRFTPPFLDGSQLPNRWMGNAVIVFKKQRKEHVARMQGIGNNVPMTHDQG